MPSYTWASSAKATDLRYKLDEAIREDNHRRIFELCTQIDGAALVHGEAVASEARLLLNPDNRSEKMVHIAAMLGNYYVADRSSDEAKLAALQWSEVLKDQPTWVVAQACVDWLKSDKANRRPVPGQILDKCHQITWPLRQAISNSTALIAAKEHAKSLPPPMTEEETFQTRMKMKEMVNAQ